MDVKLFAGNKEIITPKFEIRLNKTKNIIMFCFLDFKNNKEKEDLLKNINKIKKNDIEIKKNYINLKIEKINYLFNIEPYLEYKIDFLIKSGSYDMAFIFLDENKKIIEKNYPTIRFI